MAPCTIWNGPSVFGLLILLSPLAALAQDMNVAKFGDTVQVLGLMARTDQDFADGLALDLFSPTNRTLVVTNNTSPLPGNFVTGSTGESFVSLSNYSWIVKMNETAKDLIAKIELPFDPVAIKQLGVDVSNTYVGTLAPDGKSWIVTEDQRNVHLSENNTRIIKMTSLDGEYMVLGRKTLDTANIFVQYGQGATRTVNVTGGSGVQEAEFVDGLRFSVMSGMPFKMNVDIPHGVDQTVLPGGSISLNSFAWTVNTTTPVGNTLATTAKFPYNKDMLAVKAPGYNPKDLVVAMRPLGADSTAHFAIMGNQKVVRSKNQIVVSGLTQLDGQYVVLVMNNMLGTGGDGNRRRR